MADQTDHDQQGLIKKYLVFRTVEGEALTDPEAVTIMVIDKNGEGVRYRGRPVKTDKFILSPEKTDDYGAASREAIRAYAEKIYFRNPQLGKDLREWMNRIEGITEEPIPFG